MAVQPLSPANDRRLGEPLPHQLANQTRGHLSAINLWQQDHAVSLHYAVLAVVSNCCPPLKGRFLTRYSPVRHCPQLPLTEVSFRRVPFDLHVLSTPPAFVLSQDQTLNKMVSKQAFRLVQIILLKLISASKTVYRLCPRVIDLTPSHDFIILHPIGCRTLVLFVRYIV